MANSRLFKPLRIGNIQLSHRIGLSPLTRLRASDEHVPTDLMIEYYSQRSSVPGTLLISEGTFISQEDGGHDNVPGIYNQEQIDAWRKVTDTVHANGCYIICQLAAMGRGANPATCEREGIDYVSADAIPIGPVAPRRLTVDEIQARIENYANAARNAIAAGFDAVELHGGNGYLIDTFIQDHTNQRNDEYGGNIEARSRFAVEAVKAVCDAVGPERTGIRFSPWSTHAGMRMDDPIPQYSDIFRRLSAIKPAYLHLIEARVAGNVDVEAIETLDFVYDLWDGPLLIAGGNTPARAMSLADEKPDRDIVAIFGRHFLANPDLPFRIQKGLALNPYDRSTFYLPEAAAGYTDYPFSKEFLRGKQ